MIKFFKSHQQVLLYTQTESFENSKGYPVLHLSYEDGLSSNDRLKFLSKILNSQCEWYLSYGPDSLLWVQEAESLILSYISEDPLLHNTFQTIHYDEDSSLSEVFYKLFELGSSYNDNSIYSCFIIITDKLQEMGTKLQKMNFSQEN